MRHGLPGTVWLRSMPPLRSNAPALNCYTKTAGAVGLQRKGTRGQKYRPEFGPPEQHRLGGIVTDRLPLRFAVGEPVRRVRSSQPDGRPSGADRRCHFQVTLVPNRSDINPGRTSGEPQEDSGVPPGGPPGGLVNYASEGLRRRFRIRTAPSWRAA